MAHISDIEKTYSPKDWATLEESFAAEGRTKEECEEFRWIIINLDRQELYNEQKHHEFCESYDEHIEITNDESDGCAHINSRDALEFRSDDPVIDYYRKSPEEICIEMETRARMLSIISELREKYSKILIACDYDGITFSEYGRINGKSPQWAQQLHNRALQSLKKLLESQYADFISEAY